MRYILRYYFVPCGGRSKEQYGLHRYSQAYKSLYIPIFFGRIFVLKFRPRLS